jgi:hypothetical protein
VIDVKNSIDVTVDESTTGAYYCRVSVTGMDIVICAMGLIRSYIV